MQNKLKTVHLQPLTFTTAKASFTKEVLFHEQEPMPASPDNILYVIKRLPSQGLLQKNDQSFLLNDGFTQADVNAGLLTYSLTSVSPNRDIPQRDHALLDVTQLAAGKDTSDIIICLIIIMFNLFNFIIVLYRKQGSDIQTNTNSSTGLQIRPSRLLTLEAARFGAQRQRKRERRLVK